MTAQENTALLLIDWQNAFDDQDYWGGNRNNPDAEEKAQELLEDFRIKGMKVMHVFHDSLMPNSPLKKALPTGAPKSNLSPLSNEAIFHKHVNSGFIGTDLQGYMTRHHIHHLVISGLTTNHCVSTTTRMAGNFGYDVTLIGDACATFDRIAPSGEKFDADLIHKIALSDLHDEFCHVCSLNTYLTGAN